MKHAFFIVEKTAHSVQIKWLVLFDHSGNPGSFIHAAFERSLYSIGATDSSKETWKSELNEFSVDEYHGSIQPMRF